jgi:hypothetical protein
MDVLVARGPGSDDGGTTTIYTWDPGAKDAKNCGGIGDMIGMGARVG